MQGNLKDTVIAKEHTEYNHLPKTKRHHKRRYHFPNMAARQ